MGLRTIGELRSGAVEPGVVDVGPVLVSSPATVDGTRVYVSDPSTGEGMEVREAGLLRDWPVALGRPVLLRLRYQGPSDAPVGWLTSDADMFVLDGGASPVVRTDWEQAPPFTLVSVPDVTITSLPDATGRAELSIAAHLDGRFGRVDALPGARGGLVAITTETGGLAPRFLTDWVQVEAGSLPERYRVADLRSAPPPDGSLVELDGVQATPWSSDGRFTVVQDPGEAEGLWVDAEGVFDGTSAEGSRRLWVGEVRTVGDTLRLRILQLGPPSGTEVVRVGEEVVDGAVVELVVAQVGQPDSLGRQQSDQGRLLPRLASLDDLEVPSTVRVAVDGADGSDLAFIRVVDEPGGEAADTATPRR